MPGACASKFLKKNFASICVTNTLRAWAIIHKAKCFVFRDESFITSWGGGSGYIQGGGSEIFLVMYWGCVKIK